MDSTERSPTTYVSNKDLDLITLGRSSVDLYGQQIGGRLEDMSSFAKYVGGSPTNTAIGASRLGLRSGLITRVGADHMGRFILEQLVQENIDTQGVTTDQERLTALVLLGIVNKDTFPLIFYRENCADMALQSDHLDAAWIGSARALLINGTHLSRDQPRQASLEAARLIREAGGKLIFDIDYRPVLWNLLPKDNGELRYIEEGSVTQTLQSVAALCDVIIGTEDEIRILGGRDDIGLALDAIRALTQALIVVKTGAKGCTILSGAPERRIDVPGFAVDVLNVLGAGDAFAAGFLKAWLTGQDLYTCGLWGNACGAIVVSRHGCSPAMPTQDELTYFMSAATYPLPPEAQAQLDHIHWASTRRSKYDELTVLAIDHRDQFEEIAAELAVGAERISDFKQLAVKALHATAKGAPGFGVLLDSRYGSVALDEAAKLGYWIGRPIETPKSRPLTFESSADVGMEILRWPSNQVVKCLIYYHPDDDPVLQAAQEAQVLRLFDACRQTGHELILEVILPTDIEAGDDTVARAMRRLYEIGIKPDWWKLEPAVSQVAWDNISAVIQDCDPLCHGVVLLGLSAPSESLVEAFRVAAAYPCIKGFAIGRTIFHDVAVEWFRDRLSDEQAIAAMAQKLSNLVHAWRTARQVLEPAA
ncbi:5-dehydro-2-deoxygluconokinase (plasmid) [Asticcacaulis sp. MM231]|uniref:bifunctional 5-dehydro-2-deoxygluconokinase/5-dehydro-2- deoxyphosphogluconate aldolase n=1 Tax=Asticcacaulis sp. MM231 TaxID=3157666 RepID=UPI0032D56862